MSSSTGTILTTAAMVGKIVSSGKKLERMHLNYKVRKQNIDIISAMSSNPIV